jgi:hypothetical protein
MLTCQADAHYLHTELESSLSKQTDRPKLKKTRMQNCVARASRDRIATQLGSLSFEARNHLPWMAWCCCGGAYLACSNGSSVSSIYIYIYIYIYIIYIYIYTYISKTVEKLLLHSVGAATTFQ